MIKLSGNCDEVVKRSIYERKEAKNERTCGCFK